MSVPPRAAGRCPVPAPTPRPRSAWPRQTRRGPGRARSYAIERQAHGIARQIRDTLDAVHELAHEKETAAVFTIDGPRLDVDRARVEIEAAAFIAHFDDQPPLVDDGLDVNVFGRIFGVAAENRVGEGFGQRDGDDEIDLPQREVHRQALALHLLDDALDEPDITGDVQLDHTSAGITRVA